MLSLSLCLAGVYLTYSFFRLLSSVPPVSCTYFAALVGLMAVVSCRSACHLALSIAFPCRLGELGTGVFTLALLS